jgi:hypothetical protein
MCHTLFRGKTTHIVRGTEVAPAGPGTTKTDASTLASPTDIARPPRILLVIGSRARYG